MNTYKKFIVLLISIICLASSCTRFDYHINDRSLASEQDYYQRANLSFYHYAETTFFSENDPRRFGIEMEFGGLNSRESAYLIKDKLGGQIEVIKRDINIGVKEVLGNGEIIYDVITIDDYKVKNTRAGDITVITEYNETESVVDLKVAKPVTEVISEPVNLKVLPALQEMADAFKEAGAVGTDIGRPVGIQVTTELSDGLVSDKMNEFIVDLLRTIVNKKNRRENRFSLNVLPEREPYLHFFSENFKLKLMNLNYRPSMQELFDDFIYRQTLELMKLEESNKAWKMSIKEVKKIVLSQEQQLIAEVAKFQPIKITSLLIMLRPNDPMSKLFHEVEKWIKPGPVLEFREANTDFKIDKVVKRALGTLNLVENHGYQPNIDKFMSEYTSVDTETIKRSRKWVKDKPNTPYVYRYLIGKNPVHGNDDYEYEVTEYAKDKNVILGYLPEEVHGIKPLVLPGESIVFHRRPHHRHSIMGKYNPALVNYNIGQAIEHKYLEYRFWQEFAPGAMPRTVNLKELDVGSDPKSLLEALNKEFPQGWILKGVFDLATEQHLVTDDLDILGEIDRYNNSDFNTYYEKMKLVFAGEDIEDIISEVKTHPNYFGWKLSQFFSKPHEVIAQSKVKIKTEYRVEVIAGKVLGEGTTVDRYAYMKRSSDSGIPSKEISDRVEKFTQQIVDTLPKEFQRMTFAFDIALLEDGSMTMIESNPGGNSGFLAQSQDSIHALNRRLSDLAIEMRESDFNTGLTPRSQMKWLKEKVLSWGLELSEIPDLVWHDDHFADNDFKPITLEKKYIKKRDYLKNSKGSCVQLIKSISLSQ